VYVERDVQVGKEPFKRYGYVHETKLVKEKGIYEKRPVKETYICRTRDL